MPKVMTMAVRISACGSGSAMSSGSAYPRIGARPAGLAPILGYAEPEEMSDPLPQALILTAIVITFGVAAFLLAMIHRSWRLAHQEVVGTDEEDRRVAARKATDADELDPDDLAPEDRAAMHADSLPADADDLSDDVDLPVGGGGR